MTRPETVRQYAATGTCVFVIVAAVVGYFMATAYGKDVQTEGALALAGLAASAMAYLMGMVGKAPIERVAEPSLIERPNEQEPK